MKAYLAERREELEEVALVEAKDVVEALTRQAFFTFDQIFSIPIEGPEDIPNLPDAAQRLIKGWKWDQHGNFVLELVDRDAALDKLARILGVYQTDAQNWQDKKENLLNDLFWQWVISHHVHTGKPVPELATYASTPRKSRHGAKKSGFSDRERARHESKFLR